MATRSPTSDPAVASRSPIVAILGSVGFLLFVLAVIFVLGLFLAVALFVVLLVVAASVSDPEAVLESTAGWLGVVWLTLETAILGVATLALAWLSIDRNWVPKPAIGFSMPTERQLLEGAGTVVVLVAVAFGLEFLFGLFGVTASEHQLVDMEFQAIHFVALVPVSILLIGPVEELLFRGLIQNYVRPGLGAEGAVVWTSLLFAIIHVPAYYLLGLEAALASVTIVFVLSLFLGGLYERQRNIFVVMLVHGVYNSVLFIVVGLETLGVFG